MNWLRRFKSISSIHVFLASPLFFYILLGVSSCVGIFTYLMFEVYHFALNYFLVGANLVLLITLLAVIISKLNRIYKKRQRGSAGARFHFRLVLFFCGITILPMFVVYFVSSSLFDRGIDSLSQGVSKHMFENADRFLEKLKDNIHTSVNNRVSDLSKDLSGLNINWKKATEKALAVLEAKREEYGMRALWVADYSRKILMKSGENISEKIIPQQTWELLKEGKYSILGDDSSMLVIATYPFETKKKTKLCIIAIENFNPDLLTVIRDFSSWKSHYAELESDQWKIKVSYAIGYGLFAFLCLLIAIGMGILFADYITKPISYLISIAQKVRRGNWSVRIRMQPHLLEFLGLAKAFNQMMNEVQFSQQKTLEQKSFMENTLKGLTSGVLGLDQGNVVKIFNASAQSILEFKTFSKQAKLFSVFPEIMEWFLSIQASKNLTETHDHLLCVERSGKIKHLLAHVTFILDKSSDIKTVITLDDITDLQEAQKKAVWNDVARRVAHEIKNPLTPIHLSVERLQRKVSASLPAEEREILNSCSEVILRQVGEIHRIVKEFSSLARMPQPKMTNVDMRTILTNSIVLYKNAYPKIAFVLVVPEDSVIVFCDEQLIGQVVSNLLINAIDSVQEFFSTEKMDPAPIINVVLEEKEDGKFIFVRDNGGGVPENMLEQVMSAYITTKHHGSGLGLFISRKIVEDHQGRMRLKNVSPHGVEVELFFPNQKHQEN